MSAQVGGRTRAVHDERVGNVVLRRVEDVCRSVEPDVVAAAPIELGEERLEPVGVFVVNGNRLHGAVRVKVAYSSDSLCLISPDQRRDFVANKNAPIRVRIRARVAWKNSVA